MQCFVCLLLHCKNLSELRDSQIMNSVYLAPLIHTRLCNKPVLAQVKSFGMGITSSTGGEKICWKKSKDYFVNESVPFSDVRNWLTFIQSVGLFAE